MRNVKVHNEISDFWLHILLSWSIWAEFKIWLNCKLLNSRGDKCEITVVFPDEKHLRSNTLSKVLFCSPFFFPLEKQVIYCSMLAQSLFALFTHILENKKPGILPGITFNKHNNVILNQVDHIPHIFIMNYWRRVTVFAFHSLSHLTKHNVFCSPLCFFF